MESIKDKCQFCISGMPTDDKELMRCVDCKVNTYCTHSDENHWQPHPDILALIQSERVKVLMEVIEEFQLKTTDADDSYWFHRLSRIDGFSEAVKGGENG